MNLACTRGTGITVDGVEPAPCATGGCQVVPSIDNCTLNATGPTAGGPAPLPPRPRPPGPATIESICSSAIVAGRGSSTWNHMPGCWGAPESQRAPGVAPSTLLTAPALWL